MTCFETVNEMFCRIGYNMVQPTLTKMNIHSSDKMLHTKPQKGNKRHRRSLHGQGTFPPRAPDRYYSEASSMPPEFQGKMVLICFDANDANVRILFPFF